MKTITFSTLILILALIIIGCQKRPEEATASESAKVDTSAKVQFRQSDVKISKFLDQLDDPSTSQDIRKQILCVDYPSEYKNNYMPALLQLSPNDYTETKLMKNLDAALNYYKEKDNIHC